VPHTEIVKGNIKIILAVLWVLIRKFHIVDPALRNATATGTRFASATHSLAFWSMIARAWRASERFL
jgi:hypothetical protein